MNMSLYWSQYGQEKYFDEQIFKGKTNGIFIDIGAVNGLAHSNTYLFEMGRGWTGLCVEPNKVHFEELVKNRKCACENVAVSDYSGSGVYWQLEGYCNELSGLANKYSEPHKARIAAELRQYGGSKTVLQVPVMTLSALLEKHKIFRADLCSIDTEGGELEILHGLDFDEFIIDYFLIENENNWIEIPRYMISKGYSQINKLGIDDVYIRNTL
jgi:FkbM family methyltransferase